MEHAQTRWLVGLGIVLVLVVGALVIQGSPDPQRPDGDVATVWTVDPAAVERIWIEREKPDLAFERSGDLWRMTEPVNAVADSERMRALFRVLAVEQGQLVHDAVDLDEYGLGNVPSASVRVQLKGGLERTLVIGDAVPVGFRTYMLSEDGRAVAVNGDGHRVVQEKVEAFRDHSVFSVDPARVREASVWSPQGRLTMRGEGTIWGLDDFGRADPNRVDEVVMGILGLRFDILWEQDTWVEAPRFGAQLVLDDGTVHTFHAGQEGPLGVVSSSSDGRYGTVFPELLLALGRGPTSVADPHVFPIDPEDVDGIEVVWGPRRVDLTRNGAGWEVSGLDVVAAHEAVQKWSDAAVVYKTTPPEGAYEGSGQVTIRSQEGGLRVVTIGVVEGPFRIVRDVAHPTPYRMDDAELQRALSAIGL